MDETRPLSLNRRLFANELPKNNKVKNKRLPKKRFFRVVNEAFRAKKGRSSSSKTRVRPIDLFVQIYHDRNLRVG